MPPEPEKARAGCEAGWLKLVGIGLAAVLMVLDWLIFLWADQWVHHKPALVQAAQLGRLEWRPMGWIYGQLAASVFGFSAVAAAFGWGAPDEGWFPRGWRGPIIALAAVAMAAPGLGYAALSGRTAIYAASTELGLVTPDGVIHHPWTQAVSAEIGCALRGGRTPDRAVIRFKVAFADGQADQFQFVVQGGDPGRMIDWDLWVAYQIRQAHRGAPKGEPPMPEITPNPDCDAFVRGVNQPGFLAKYQQLFAPADRLSRSRRDLSAAAG